MDNPIDMLIDSFQQAKAAGDTNGPFFAMTTLDESGFPMSRTVTVREISSAGIVIYINRVSPKIEQLKLNPAYELLFFWPSQLRQFRVRGSYEIFENEDQRCSWEQKPYAGKLYDLFQIEGLSQSSELPSREAYLETAAEIRARFPEESSLEMPHELVCLGFQPDYVESWYGDMKDRLHDRRLFRLQSDGDWSEQVLVP